jgi:hypothetical protein
LSETYCCLDSVLLWVWIFIHLSKDQISTFLIDSDLSLNNHVINESDEGSQAVVVSLGKL